MIRLFVLSRHNVRRCVIYLNMCSVETVLIRAVDFFHRPLLDTRTICNQALGAGSSADAATVNLKPETRTSARDGAQHLFFYRMRTGCSSPPKDGSSASRTSWSMYGSNTHAER